MHPSSYRLMAAFVRDYLSNGSTPVTEHDDCCRVLDVGSQDVNGTYRPLFDSPLYNYTGLDISQGKNVDLVVTDQYAWKEVRDQSYDIVISGQCLEHVGKPWLVMREMARVLKPGGLMCVIVPSQGSEHRFPIDTYRYMPDGMRELGTDAGLQVLELERSATRPWKDIRAIYTKGNSAIKRYRRSLNESRPTETLPNTTLSWHRRQIINMAVVACGARSYLEIGVSRPKNTFNHIWCTDKIGVDPAVLGHPDILPTTSDDFFRDCERCFDVIFVDGDHRLEAVRSDVENAFAHLNDGGVVAMHDVNPTRPAQALPEPHRVSSGWCGEAWRVFLHYRCLAEFDAIAIPDNSNGGVGVGLIVRGRNEDRLDINPQTIDTLSYDMLDQNRQRWLRLINPDEVVHAVHQLVRVKQDSTELSLGTCEEH